METYRAGPVSPETENASLGSGVETETSIDTKESRAYETVTAALAELASGDKAAIENNPYITVVSERSL